MNMMNAWVYTGQRQYTLLIIHDAPETHLDFNYPERNIITIPYYTFLPASFYRKYGLTSAKPI